MRGFSYNNGFKNNTQQRGRKGVIKSQRSGYDKSKALFSLSVTDCPGGFKFGSKPVYNEK